MSDLERSTEQQQRTYDSLGKVALIGADLVFPFKESDEQPDPEQMKKFIASNGYDEVQPVGAPYTHIIAVDAHQVEPTPLVYYFAEIR